MRGVSKCSIKKIIMALHTDNTLYKTEESKVYEKKLQIKKSNKEETLIL